MARTRLTPIQEYNPYKFRVHLQTATNTGNNAFAKVPYETRDYDTSSNVDITTNKGRFTAPIAGFYQFNAHATTSAAATILIIGLFKNGVEYTRGGDIRVSTAQIQGVTVSDIIQLAANDYIEAYVFGNAAIALDVAGSPYTNYFSGFLVSAT